MFINEDKIKVENVEVAGLETAIRGMRNPMNSWDKSDSFHCRLGFTIGNNDMDLAKRLINAGTEHRKFLRQIYVGFDLTLPRYLWSEFDTYGWTSKNSCSTMHKLFQKDKLITKEQFLYSDIEIGILDVLIDELNILRACYFKVEDMDKKNEILRIAKSLLPEGFLQKRTVATNYEVLRNMYHQRKNHRLPEWQVICMFIETLPYSEQLIVGGK